MTDYKVRWEIDIDAETPEEAAMQAFAIQRDQESLATVFEVDDKKGNTVTIDIGVSEK